jgi:hypothetical protein
MAEAHEKPLTTIERCLISVCLFIAWVKYYFIIFSMILSVKITAHMLFKKQQLLPCLRHFVSAEPKAGHIRGVDVKAAVIIHSQKYGVAQLRHRLGVEPLHENRA